MVIFTVETFHFLFSNSCDALNYYFVLIFVVFNIFSKNCLSLPLKNGPKELTHF